MKNERKKYEKKNNEISKKNKPLNTNIDIKRKSMFKNEIEKNRED